MMLGIQAPSQVGRYPADARVGKNSYRNSMAAARNNAMPMPDIVERLWNVMAEGMAMNVRMMQENMRAILTCHSVSRLLSCLALVEPALMISCRAGVPWVSTRTLGEMSCQGVSE